MNERQSDFEWLQQFARAGNQNAFREVVRRHLDLVFATALRKAGDAGGAEEISQNVFTALARKAWQFAPDDSLPAWLHKTALLESKSWLRGESRRRRREQTAAELGTTMKIPDEQPALRALVPLLDEALLSLREKERTALLLRFYEAQSLRDVGTALGVNEDAAQKRVAGALEKLSQFFQRRGFKTATVVVTTAALKHTAASASATTASAIVNAALQTAPPALVGLGALLARLASMTKVQTAAVCVALAALPAAWQWSEAHSMGKDATRIQIQLAESRTELLSLQTEIERLRETSERLDVSLATATDSASQRATAAEKFAAWKQRIRGWLTAADYRWPDDSPFVRIPKSALLKISPNRTITPPGTVEPEARELLGLTPQEREAAEAALHNYFADVEGLIETKLYETNRPARGRLPQPVLASRTFVIPALGSDAKGRADEMLAAMKNTLGNERWPLVAASLDSYGTHTLRRILNLDAFAESQEVSVWVRDEKAGPVTGYSWASGGTSLSMGGGTLSAFLPGADSDAAKNVVADFRRNDLSDALTSRMLSWLHQEATARLGPEDKP